MLYFYDKMKVRACFLLFGIFANTQSFASIPEIGPKRINLALKTVLEFHAKDKKSDIKLLDDIQNVITEIRTIVDENGNTKNFRRSSRDDTLTGFIQDAINILNTYEDTVLDEFLHILDAEIRKYHYRGCKFSELAENHKIVKLVTAKLESIKNRSTYIKKRKINALSGILKHKDYDGDVIKIMDYINSLYAQAGDKFRRFLSNLEHYGKSKSIRSNTNLVEIIRNGLQSIIFDHYTNLNVNTRRHLRHQIEHFWRRYKKNHLSKRDNAAKVTPYIAKNSMNFINKAKDLETDSKKYQTNKINTKQSKRKNKIPKKHHLKNERKQQKDTRKETIDESFKIQAKKTGQSSKNTDLLNQPWYEIKLQGQTGDVDSLSASFNSMESHKGQQDSTQQSITIVPHKYRQKSSKVTKIPERIDMNVTTKTPADNSIQKKLLWIEQSTGRLPKAVLDKLANKASRSNPELTGDNLNKYEHKHKKSKNKKRWYRKVYKLNKTRRKGYEQENAKTDEKMYDPENQKTLRYSELKLDNTNKKIYQQENKETYGGKYKQAGGNIFESDNIFLFINKDEDVQKYNKTKGMLRLELKYDNTSIRFTPEPGKTIKHLVKGTATAKKAPAFTKPPRSQFDDTERRELTHQPPPQSNSSKGWLHIELPLTAYSKSNNKWSKNHDSYPRKSTEYSRLFKEGVTPTNIKKIDSKKRGINRANDNTEEGSKVTHRFEVKRYVEKPKPIETMSLADETLKQDTQKMANTAYQEMDSVNYVTDKDSKIKEYDKVGLTFRSGVNIIPDNFKVKDKLSAAKTAVYKTEFPTEDDNRHNAQTTSFSYLKESFEGQLNRGINRVNEDETKEGKHRFEVIRYVEKPTQIETMTTLDVTLKQDTTNMADIADHKIDLFNNVTDKVFKIKDYKVKHKTEGRTQNGTKLKYKYAENNKKDREESETGFKTGLQMLPIDNMVRLNMTAGTSVNKIEHMKENNNIQDQDSVNNNMSVMKFRSDDTEVTETAYNITEYKDSIINLDKGKKSQTNIRSDINVMPTDLNEKIDLITTRTPKIKVDFNEKENYFKSKEDLVDKNYQIYQVEEQPSLIREVPKEKVQIEKDTNLQHFDDVPYFEAKHREMNDQGGGTLIKGNEIKVPMKDKKDDNRFGTQTPTKSIASTSSSMKGTERTTRKASATTVVQTAPPTPKLTAPVSIPVVTSSKTSAFHENLIKMPDQMKTFFNL